MSAHYWNDGVSIGVIHLADIYTFKGFTFEFHRYCGPMRCRKDGDPFKRPAINAPKFYAAVEEWEKLTKEQKEETRIYG